MTPQAVPRRGQRGFTLLELALTMLVMGILLAIAVPRLPRLGRTNLEASADRLASTMTYLADEASLRGRIYRLNLDFVDNRWDIAAIAPYAAEDGRDKAEFREDGDDPMARTIALPPGVYFDAVFDHDGQTASATRSIYFLPEGLTESLHVRLAENDGARTDVVLDATLGSAWREDTVEEPR